MTIKKIDYNKVEPLSSKDLSYINKEESLKPFYKYENDIKKFQIVIDDRKSYNIDRQSLVDILNRQYEGVNASELVLENILALADGNTYTIITAHQPSLFGGPLYYIYKIASTIHLCTDLNEAYPDYRFIPVFINGGEDHDFDEINHFNLYRNLIKWDVPHKGPVGRKSIDGLAELIESTSQILGESLNATKAIEILKSALDKSENYGSFVRHFVNSLFGKYGLVIANMDDKQMKSIFAPYMIKEITEQRSHVIIEETQKQLNNVGFKSQAHARDINLFYIDDSGRNRIIELEDGYGVVDTDKKWSRDDILKEVENYPERFSPNVILRPIYQEVIFPNLAYIGGGGELAYWLERKAQFEYFDVPYPMLIRRNSAAIVDNSITKKASQLDLSIEELFKPEHELISQHIDKSSSTDIHLNQEKNDMKKLWEKIAHRAAEVDPTLKKASLAEMTNQLKAIESIESRMKRKIKSDEEVNINRIKKVKELLFPNQGLQERHDNFLQYYHKHGDEFIHYLVENLDPLDNHFYLINL